MWKFPVTQNWSRRWAVRYWGWGRNHAGAIGRDTSFPLSKVLVPIRNREGLAAEDPWRTGGNDESTVKCRQHQSSKSFLAPFLLSPPSQSWRSQREPRECERKIEPPGEERETQQSYTLLTQWPTLHHQAGRGKKSFSAKTKGFWILTLKWTYSLLNGDWVFEKRVTRWLLLR